MASPGFTHVYAAMVAVINTKLPDFGKMIIHRVIQQFQMAFKRNNRVVCKAVIKMIANLVNQQVLTEVFSLELLALLLEQPTEDSVDLAIDFLIDCGQYLTDVAPSGVNVVFDRFREVLMLGTVDRKIQYSIEKLFEIRKNRFADHAGVLQELDLVEDGDKITHQVSLDIELEELELDLESNVFRFDEHYEEEEEKWE